MSSSTSDEDATETGQEGAELMKSKIVLFFTIIVCFLLQSTLLQKISIGSITPNLLVDPVCIYGSDAWP